MKQDAEIEYYGGRSSEVLPKVLWLFAWEGHVTHIVSRCVCLDVSQSSGH
jgi:hypothetical protein